MKNIIFLFLLTCSAQLFSQVTDTSFRVNVNGVFFLQRNIAYQNGEQDNSRRLIGDTLTFQAREAETTEQFASRATSDAEFISQTPKRLRDLQRLSDETGAITGTTTLRTIQLKYDSNFVGKAYTIRDDSSQTITFSRNAQNQLRYQIAGFTARNTFIFGPTLIVLNNYRNTGRDLILYRFRNESDFFDIFRRIRLRNSAQVRATLRQ